MTVAMLIGPVDRDRLKSDEGYRASLVEQVIHRVGTTPARAGRWRVEFAVEVDRTTALSLQGQAFALLYPRED